MATRDEIRWYVENDVDKEGNAIVAASVDGNEGEDEDEDDVEGEKVTVTED